MVKPAAERILHATLQMMLLVGGNDGKLPAAGERRRPLFGVVAVFCNYLAAALKAIIVVSQCSEILLSVALAFTKSLAFYLSTMLRLNALFRITLTGVFSPEELHRHGHSQTSRNWSCSSLCGGGGRTMTWLKLVLRAVPALGCCSSVCVTLIQMALSALSSLCREFRPSISAILTLCGCIRALLSTLQTVIGVSTQVTGIVCDVLSFLSSP